MSLQYADINDIILEEGDLISYARREGNGALLQTGRVIRLFSTEGYRGPVYWVEAKATVSGRTVKRLVSDVAVCYIEPKEEDAV